MKMETSETITHIVDALKKVHASLGPLAKDAANPHYKSEYISLDAMTDACKRALLAQNIIIVHSAEIIFQYINETSRAPYVRVTTRLIHESGEFIQSHAGIVLSKLDPQGSGGAITYGRRYGLALIMAIVADEDDDGNMASGISAGPPVPTARAVTKMKEEAGKPSGNRPKMPFGKTKGQYLDELPEKELESTLKWAIDKGTFDDLQKQIRAELAARKVMGALPPEPPDDDDLPWS